MQTVAYISIAMMVAAFGLSLVRVIQGPSLPDRAVALDLAGSIAAAILAISVVALNAPYLLDVLLGLSLVLFFSTTVFARYLENQRHASGDLDDKKRK